MTIYVRNGAGLRNIKDIIRILPVGDSVIHLCGLHSARWQARCEFSKAGNIRVTSQIICIIAIRIDVCGT